MTRSASRLISSTAADTATSLYGFEKSAPVTTPEYAPVGSHLPFDGGFTIWVDADGTIVCGNLPISPVISLEPFVPGPAPVPVAPDAILSTNDDQGGYTPGDILLDLEGFTVYVGNDGHTIAVGTPPETGYHLPPMPTHDFDDVKENPVSGAVGVHLPEDGGFTLSADDKGNVYCGDLPAGNGNGNDIGNVITTVTVLQNAINDFVTHNTPHIGGGIVSHMPTPIAPVGFADVFTTEIAPAHNDLIV